MPTVLKTLRAHGRHFGWVEQFAQTLDKAGGLVIFWVQAELELPNAEKPATQINPHITVSGSTLRKCGEEYRGEGVEIGQVEAYRWRDRGEGIGQIWLDYSHAIERPVESIFEDEERRCRSLLQQLG